MSIQEDWIRTILERKPGDFTPKIEQFYEDEDGNLQHNSWEEYEDQKHADNRSIFPNEVVFDYDGGQKVERKAATKAIIEVLEELNIPYFAADSGGTGYHVHVFLDTEDKEIEDWKPFRIAFYELVKEKLEEKGVDISQLDEEVVRRKKNEDANPHMIRPVGGRHEETKHRKTVVDKDLDKKEIENLDQVEFPENVSPLYIGDSDMVPDQISIEKLSKTWDRKRGRWEDGNINNGSDYRTEDIKRVSASSEWDFKNVLPENHFLNHYINHVTNLTDAYPEYHFATGLGILSHSVAGKAVAAITPDVIYPNFWTLLIGKSTVARKSTAVGKAETLLNFAALDDNIAPEDFSPEAFIDFLQDHPECAYINDEFGQVIAKMDGGYAKALPPLMSQLYDVPHKYERKLRDEEISVQYPYITFIGACVPEQLRDNIDMGDLRSGFFPRINFVFSERFKTRMPRRQMTPGETERERMLGNWVQLVREFLNHLHYRRGDKQPIHFGFEDGALDFYNDWAEEMENWIHEAEDDDLSPFFGRLSDSVLKIALLLELGSKRMLQLMLDYNEENNLVDASLIKESSIVSKSSNHSKHSSHSKSTYSPLRDPLRLLRLPQTEGESPLKISTNSIKIAIYYVENLFLPNAQKVYKTVRAHESKNTARKIYDVAVERMDEDGGVSKSEIMRYANIGSKRDFDPALQYLQEAKLVHVEPTKPHGLRVIPLNPDDPGELPSIGGIDADIEIPSPLVVEEEDIDDSPGELKGLDEGDEEFLQEDWDEEEVDVDWPNDPLEQFRKAYDVACNGSKEEVGVQSLFDMMPVSEEKASKAYERVKSDGEFFNPKPGMVKKL